MAAIQRQIVAVGLFGIVFSFFGCDLFPDPQMSKVSIVKKASDLGSSAFFPNPVRVYLGGRVLWKNEETAWMDVLAEADRGLYKAKRSGRNKIAVDHLVH